MTKILTLRDIKKTFDVGEVFEVLENISLEVNEGEFVSIIGPSGCGKSVLLYLVAGFIQKTSGDLFINGDSVMGPGLDRVMVFQDYVLFPWKTVYENILFSLEKVDISEDEKKSRAMKYMDLVGLTKFKDWHPHKLSGGMKQRVAIARALVVNSKILLMDEPFSSLDSQQRKHLQRNLLDIWEKTQKTVLFVTHSVSEALFLSDRIYVMSMRPSTIKKVYTVSIPRPRQSSDPEYIRIKESIAKDLFEEFEKRSLIQTEEVSPDALLKTQKL